MRDGEEKNRPGRRYWSCRDCGHEWFGFRTCPKCGGRGEIEVDPSNG